VFQGTKNYSEDPEYRMEGGEGYQLMLLGKWKKQLEKTKKFVKELRGMTKEKRRLESVT
jgi:hypothetical protein